MSEERFQIATQVGATIVWDSQTGDRLRVWNTREEAQQHADRLNGETALYVIKRFSQSRPAWIVESGLTLEEAQAHCNDPSTSGDGWFDGYERDAR